MRQFVKAPKILSRWVQLWVILLNSVGPVSSYSAVSSQPESEIVIRQIKFAVKVALLILHFLLQA